MQYIINQKSTGWILFDKSLSDLGDRCEGKLVCIIFFDRLRRIAVAI